METGSLHEGLKVASDYELEQRNQLEAKSAVTVVERVESLKLVVS